MADRAARLFRDRFGSEPHRLAWAPGRMNLIGEHTDHAGGLVLPAALSRHVAVAARPLDRHVLHVTSEAFGDEEADLDDDASPPGYAAYLHGVCRVLQRQGHGVPGLQVAVAADLPAEAGLSSSAALEVAFCRAAMLAGGWRITGAAAASTCRAAEREYVGVDSGIMDQLTCALARQGAALLIDCADVTVTEVPLSDDAAWILLDTGTRRHLADGAYNERRRELESARLDAERELNRALPHPARLRESDLEKLRLPSAQERRLRHVVTETRRVTAAVTALKNDDLRTLGVLMNRSHESLRDLFEVSTPALDRLQAAAVAAGALGARMMGAGFGGSVLALSRREEAASVGQTAAESGGASQWFIAESASGAFAV